MTNEEDIKLTEWGIRVFAKSIGKNDTDESMFRYGVHYGQEHPSFEMVAKIWNMATDAVVKQISNELTFKSEDDIKKYIKEHLN